MTIKTKFSHPQKVEKKLFISAVVIIGFLTKQKIIMTVHIWFMASLMAWPIFALHAVVFMLFQSLEEGDMIINTGGDTGTNMDGSMYLKLATVVFIFFLISLGNLVYIALCYILLDDIKYGHPGTLPYSSKMHGSYQDKSLEGKAVSDIITAFIVLNRKCLEYTYGCATSSLPISAIFAYFGYYRESCPIIYLHMVCSTSLLVILPWLIWNPNTHCFMLPASLKMFTYAGMNEKITEALKDKEFVKKIGKPDDEYRPPSPLFF
ncbi:Protein CBG10050 [Caenorhabditis briggsae]|uniref:Protein CBG10050 n=1 Tax=Caenorhabditis briggsae TaxID=6238 RepID=A8XA95_CAEBR|nr:Protein CBG10050 [Caenorhabditis briggsae]CAP29563.1 Protein CBG10050 [Caenorhabditis briggsae]